MLLGTPHIIRGIAYGLGNLRSGGTCAQLRTYPVRLRVYDYEAIRLKMRRRFMMIGCSLSRSGIGCYRRVMVLGHRFAAIRR
jgi:hypothetical protein